MASCANCKYSEPIGGGLACMGQKGMPYVRPTDSCDRWKTMKQTNADRIRAMSDEELAEFIGGIFTIERDPWGDYDPRTVVTQEPRVELRSMEDALDWLKQEAEE